MPTMNESALTAYWSRFRQMVDSCTPAAAPHPAKAFEGCVTVRKDNGYEFPVEPDGRVTTERTNDVSS